MGALLLLFDPAGNGTPEQAESQNARIEIAAPCCYLWREYLAPGMRRATQEDDVLSHSDPSTGLPVGPRPDMSAAEPLVDASEQMLDRVLASLDDDKAEDIVQIDLRGRSDMADYMVICSGRSSRQVASIAEKLMDRVKHEFGRISKVEGKETGDWVLIDTGDVIVHVFRPEVREFYQLEKMWLPNGTDQQHSIQD